MIPTSDTIPILDPQKPTRKTFGSTKYLREKLSDQRNTHEKKFRTNDGTMARGPLNFSDGYQKIEENKTFGRKVGKISIK